MPYDKSTAERVRRILSARRDVSSKPLMGGLCFMVKGSMCCSVSGKGGLLIRVEPQEYDQAVIDPHVEPMQMGRCTLRGFVRVAPEGYPTDEQLERWVQRGIDAAVARSASPPKAHKRPRSRTSRP